MPAASIRSAARALAALLIAGSSLSMTLGCGARAVGDERPGAKSIEDREPPRTTTAADGGVQVNPPPETTPPPGTKAPAMSPQPTTVARPSETESVVTTTPSVSAASEPFTDDTTLDPGEWSVPRTADMASSADRCSWGIAQWFADIGVELEDYTDCGTAFAEDSADDLACFAANRDLGAIVTILECAECRSSRTYVSVGGQTYQVEVDDAISSVDLRGFTVDHCVGGLEFAMDGAATCQDPERLLNCNEGHPTLRPVADPSELDDPTQVEAIIASAASDAESAGLEVVGPRKTLLTAPDECLQRLKWPLEGCKPSKASTGGIDCDGDGAAGYQAIECKRDNVQADPYQADDCDDTNPDVQVWMIEDQDGDGYGTSVSGDFFCGPKQPPAGYAPLEPLRDCEDDDAKIYPNAPEIWGDGEDSNCDGWDAPLASTLMDGQTVDAFVELNPDCDTADLYLLEHASPVCGTHPIFVVVGNGGGAAFEGNAWLSWSDDGATRSVELPTLEPGEVSPVIEVNTPSLQVDMELSDEEGASLHDCDDTNQSQSVSRATCGLH
ncbi:MAG TPA: MopE-related protein [Polyangiaceae bacterium]|nr:MopE-related protein [Polyangiaceae bacterium]